MHESSEQPPHDDSTAAPDPSPSGSMPAPVAPVRQRMTLPPARLLGGVVVIAVLVVIALVAFGSSSNSSVDPVAAAAVRSSQQAGYRMTLSMRVSSPALGQAITGSGGGSFITATREGSMSLTMNLPAAAASTFGSSALTIQEITQGTKIYMKLPSKLMGALGSVGKKWIGLDFAKLSGIPGLGSLESNPASSNPAEMLSYLRAASSSSIVNEGRATVDGFQTTEYHGTLDFSKIPDALPASERAQAQAAIGAIEKEAQFQGVPFSVWIGTDHLVRRIEMTISATASGQSLQEAFTIGFPDYGPQAAPPIPPASEVANVSSLGG